MQLEEYFEFIADDAVRIAGTRVGIETVLDDYQKGATPEEIALHYPNPGRVRRVLVQPVFEQLFADQFVP